MTILFSNHKLLNTYAMEVAIIACFFVTFAILAFNQFLLSGLFVVLALLCLFLIFLIYKQQEQVYLEITNETITIHHPITSNKVLIAHDEVGLIVRRGDSLIIHLKNEAKLRKINLNYLNQEDIKKLLLFLSYAPSLKTTFL